MAEKDYVRYNETNLLASGDLAKVRRLEAYVDFTVAGNQTAGATDNLNLFQLPVGAVVVAAGIEQLIAGSAGNTMTARVGSVAMSSALASDAAVGTFTTTATTALDGDAGTLSFKTFNIATAVDFNLLSASAVRATGMVRAWVVIIEGDTRVNYPTIAQRDASLVV